MNTYMQRIGLVWCLTVAVAGWVVAADAKVSTKAVDDAMAGLSPSESELGRKLVAAVQSDEKFAAAKRNAEDVAAELNREKSRSIPPPAPGQSRATYVQQTNAKAARVQELQTKATAATNAMLSAQRQRDAAQTQFRDFAKAHPDVPLNIVADKLQHKLPLDLSGSGAYRQALEVQNQGGRRFDNQDVGPVVDLRPGPGQANDPLPVPANDSTQAYREIERQNDENALNREVADITSDAQRLESDRATLELLTNDLEQRISAHNSSRNGNENVNSYNARAERYNGEKRDLERRRNEWNVRRQQLLGRVEQFKIRAADYGKKYQASN